MGQSTSVIEGRTSRSQLRTFIKDNCSVIEQARSKSIISSETRSSPIKKVLEAKQRTDTVSTVNCQFENHNIEQDLSIDFKGNKQVNKHSLKDCQFLIVIQGNITSSRFKIWRDRMKSRYLLNSSHFSTCTPHWEQYTNDEIHTSKHLFIIVDPDLASSTVRNFICSDQQQVLTSDKSIKRGRSVCLESEVEKIKFVRLVRSLEQDGHLSFHSSALFTHYLLSQSEKIDSLSYDVHRLNSLKLLALGSHNHTPIHAQVDAPITLDEKCSKDWFYSQCGQAPSKRKRVFGPIDMNSPVRQAACSPQKPPCPRKLDCFDNDDDVGDTHQVKTGSGLLRPQLKRNSFACQRPQPSTNDFNATIASSLCQIAETIHLTKTPNSEFRSRAYKNLALRVARFPRVLTCAEELNEESPYLSAKMLSRVNEVIQGDHPVLHPDTAGLTETVKELQGIWGVGHATALKWASYGIGGVAHLRQIVDTPQASKLKISRCQKIGLSRYEDLLDRMSREEAGLIGERVREAVNSLLPGCEVVQCGSYRRGKSLCGDVDILIAPPRGYSTLRECEHLLKTSQQSLDFEDQDISNEVSLFLSALLNRLNDFITDVLTVNSSGDSDSFMGVCKVSDSALHRRLDIKCYSRAALPFAVLYFTGSAHFNRSMRLWAKKQGWKLLDDRIQHRVASGCQREKLDKQAANITTEKDVFNFLGLEYRTPAERDVSNVCLTSGSAPSGAYRAQKRI